MAPFFEFDKSTQQYRYKSGDRNGQFVSIKQLQGLTVDYQSQQVEQGQRILAELLNKDITVNNWMRQTASHLKQSHINMFALGFGGHRKMGAGEYGAIGNRLRKEYEYLRQFALEIQDGKLSEAQISARLALYYGSTWQTYQRARERAHKANGYTQERRVTQPGKVCGDCAGYALRGWVAIGELPAPGDQSVCKVHCRCSKEFARDGDEIANLLSLKHGWIGMRSTATEEKTSTQDASIGTDIDGLYWGEPNEEDLKIIHQTTGFSWKPADWFMVPVQASDNLLWSSWECCWHSSVLENMADQFPGQSLMTDHSFGVEDTEGFFTRSALIRSQVVPLDVLDSQGHGVANRLQVRREGYLQLYLQAAIPATEEKTIQSLKTRRKQHLSTGSILNGSDFICPHCSAALGRDVSFYEVNATGGNVCPHEVPHPMTKWMAEIGLFDEDLLFADYAILKSLGGERHYETSFVYVGNLAGAQVVRPRIKLG